MLATKMADCPFSFTTNAPHRTTRVYSLLVLLLVAATLLPATHGFSVQPQQHYRTTSALYAIGPLVRQAKLAELRQWMSSGGLDDKVKPFVQQLQADDGKKKEKIQTLQQKLTAQRRGTLAVIAEFTKVKDEKKQDSPYHDAELLSAAFRGAGCCAVAVRADERSGNGCNYDDLATIALEQRRAANNVPGPALTINSDVIVDPLQLARTCAVTGGVQAVLLSAPVLGVASGNSEDEAEEEDLLGELMDAAVVLELEPIVAVHTAAEAQAAVEAGAGVLAVHGPTVEDKVAVVADVDIDTVATIAVLTPSADAPEGAEIAEAWECRETKRFHAAWVGDALYRAENSNDPAAVCQSIRAKSSRTWATPTPRSGRGEGAREYLGDIMM